MSGLAREKMLCLIAGHVEETRQQHVPYLIGVSGMETAGKSRLAEDLKGYLADEFKVTIIHLDDFFYPKAVRYASANDIDNYLYRSVDFRLFEERILKPLKQVRSLCWDACLLELATDEYTKHVKLKVDSDEVVIIEGVFLFREPWRHYFQLRIFLKIAAEVAMERGIRRDADRHGEDVRRRYEMKYLPAQLLHGRLDSPEQHADIVIDNNHFDRPVIVASRLGEKRGDGYRKT